MIYLPTYSFSHLSVCFILNIQKRSNPIIFKHFDFKVCFAPQRPAIFRNLNFQKLSTYNGNVLCSTIAGNFCIPGLAREWLRTHRFGEPLFDPSDPQIVGKTQRFAIFLIFRAPVSSFFWLYSSILLSSMTLFHICFSSLSILSKVLTSKLPLNNLKND